MAGRTAPNTTPSRSHRGRRTKEMPNGRSVLLAAATQAFANDGFKNADLRGIAAAAGVSPNLVRVHFGNKSRLWEVCLDAIVETAKPTITEVAEIAGDDQKTLVERLRGIVTCLAVFYASHPEVREFVTRYFADTPERASLVTDRLLKPAYETCHELFAAGIQAGIIRSAHPALFFALLSRAASQPASFPLLLSSLAPEIDADVARSLMTETIIATLIHEPRKCLSMP